MRFSLTRARAFIFNFLALSLAQFIFGLPNFIFFIVNSFCANNKSILKWLLWLHFIIIQCTIIYCAFALSSESKKKKTNKRKTKFNWNDSSFLLLLFWTSLCNLTLFCLCGKWVKNHCKCYQSIYIAFDCFSSLFISSSIIMIENMQRNLNLRGNEDWRKKNKFVSDRKLFPFSVHFLWGKIRSEQFHQYKLIETRISIAKWGSHSTLFAWRCDSNQNWLRKIDILSICHVKAPKMKLRYFHFPIDQKKSCVQSKKNKKKRHEKKKLNENLAHILHVNINKFHLIASNFNASQSKWK